MKPSEDTGGADARRLMAARRALSRRFSLSERDDAECCGITRSQAATLEALSGERGVRLGELGRRLGIHASTLTRNLARLVDQGLVRRIGDDRDGRARCATLTEAGRKAAARIARRDLAFARDLLQRVPAARRGRAVEALDDLLVAVREATESCCPGAFEHLMEEFQDRRTL